jgi:hypothetical protein
MTKSQIFCTNYVVKIVLFIQAENSHLSIWKNTVQLRSFNNKCKDLKEDERCQNSDELSIFLQKLFEPRKLGRTILHDLVRFAQFLTYKDNQLIMRILESQDYQNGNLSTKCD